MADRRKLYDLVSALAVEAAAAKMPKTTESVLFVIVARARYGIQKEMSDGVSQPKYGNKWGVYLRVNLIVAINFFGVLEGGVCIS